MMQLGRQVDGVPRLARQDGRDSRVVPRAADFLLAASLLLPSSLVLRAQEPSAQPQVTSPQHAQSVPDKPGPQSTLSVEVRVVNVYATVRKKKGEIVSDLTKDDFKLEEDGRPQTIQYFSRESDLPLDLGLLVDTSGSQRRMLDQERSASSSFIDQVLRVDKDKAFVIHFDHEVELLQDLTSSREKLQAAIGLLGEPQMAQRDPDSSPSMGPDAGSGRHGSWGGGTMLYDAIYLASNEIMRHQQNRKAVIVLSDGVDRGSRETLASAIEAAQRADTIVYSILFADEEGYGYPGGYGGMGGMGGGMGRHGGRGRYPQEERPDGKKILEQISKATGGRLFQVSKKEPIEQIYASIQEELRNQYSLGYTPTPPNSGVGYHKVGLTLGPKDLIVQARAGYYSDR